MAPAPAHVRLKVCCIGTRAEAGIAVAHGADALGFVAPMPSGPGAIDEAAIADLVPRVPPAVATFLLTPRTDAATIVAQARRTGVNTLQLVDFVAQDMLERLRVALPVVRLVQVVHVLDDDSVREAEAVAPFVDALLLDSGNPRLAVKELGGTGRVHDWSLSRAIRDLVDVPVFLAGGLHAGNVGEAVARVRPFGIDVCSGVRTDGRLDAGKLDAFARAVAGG
ncbi:phosphoribosylanthranilate isomerase [Roseisolibacter sp. H3M3-2]|uniref:phosphoribosylanthranilate isomerase n=1 Tax=Roseisolibacter sp. H3M3-2 TaxID=3031323 RepID=UPI0031F303F1